MCEFMGRLTEAICPPLTLQFMRGGYDVASNGFLH